MQLSTRPSYKTPYPQTQEVKWYIVDANGATLGKLATRVAQALMGKHVAAYNPQYDDGFRVVVINAAHVKLTGNKLTQKMYYRYTGWIGGLKETRADEMIARKPEKMIEQAVRGMLPKTILGRKMLKNLRVYPGVEHPHAAQKPETLEIN